VLGFFLGILPGKIQEDSSKIPGRSWKFQEENFLKIILERFNIYYVLFYKLHIFFL
jgi:hypothetical protein